MVAGHAKGSRGRQRVYHVCTGRAVSRWAGSWHGHRLSGTLYRQQHMHAGLKQQPGGQTQQLASVCVPQPAAPEAGAAICNRGIATRISVGLLGSSKMSVKVMVDRERLPRVAVFVIIHPKSGKNSHTFVHDCNGAIEHDKAGSIAAECSAS
jgi:hypothetical protein